MDKKNKNNLITLKFITVTLMIVGSLVWGLIALSGFNIVNWFSNFTGLSGILDRIIYALVGASGLIFLFQHYNLGEFLPFLGETIIPVQLFTSEQVPDNWNQELQIKAPKGITHVVYWASDNKEEHNTQGPELAYGQYSNSGVAKVENDGYVVLKFRKPTQYKVRGKVLPEHVHYRWVLGPNKLSAVQTTRV